MYLLLRGSSSLEGLMRTKTSQSTIVKHFQTIPLLIEKDPAIRADDDDDNDALVIESQNPVLK